MPNWVRLWSERAHIGSKRAQPCSKQALPLVDASICWLNSASSKPREPRGGAVLFCSASSRCAGRSSGNGVGRASRRPTRREFCGASVHDGASLAEGSAPGSAAASSQGWPEQPKPSRHPPSPAHVHCHAARRLQLRCPPVPGLPAALQLRRSGALHRTNAALPMDNRAHGAGEFASAHHVRHRPGNFAWGPRKLNAREICLMGQRGYA